MSGVLLDTHVVHWWSAEPERVSKPARRALESMARIAPGVRTLTAAQGAIPIELLLDDTKWQRASDLDNRGRRPDAARPSAPKARSA